MRRSCGLARVLQLLPTLPPMIELRYVIIMPVVSLWYAIGWSLKVLLSLVFFVDFHL